MLRRIKEKQLAEHKIIMQRSAISEVLPLATAGTELRKRERFENITLQISWLATVSCGGYGAESQLHFSPEYLNFFSILHIVLFALCSFFHSFLVSSEGPFDKLPDSLINCKALSVLSKQSEC